jgi:hypothetical protein
MSLLMMEHVDDDTNEDYGSGYVSGARHVRRNAPRNQTISYMDRQASPPYVETQSYATNQEDIQRVSTKHYGHYLDIERSTEDERARVLEDVHFDEQVACLVSCDMRLC